MRRLKVLLLLSTVLCTLANCARFAAAQQSADSQHKIKGGFDIDAIDRSVDPCVDFYQYSCGSWLKQNPVPPDRTVYGRASELVDRNRLILRDVLEKASVADANRSANEQKIGDYYASCMDEDAAEKKGISPLEPELARVGAIQTKNDLAPVLAHMSLVGTNALFGFGVQQDSKDSTQQIAVTGQGGLGLPDRDFYFRDDATTVGIRKQYVEHIQNMLVLFGEQPPDAAKHAQVTMRIETALAKGALDNVSLRDPNKVYHRMNVEELQGLSPTFEWKRFLEDVGLPRVASLNVSEPEFVRQLQTILKTNSVGDLKTYLRWRVLNTTTLFLPKKIDQEAFHFNSQVLAGQKQPLPRWKRCIIATDGDLGEALGQVYVERAFGPESKRRTLQLVASIEDALQRDINDLPWMTEATKKQALIKLHKVANKIGYPDKWRDYSSLQIIRGDGMGNSLRSSEFESRRQFGKIGQPVDSGEWLYSPPTVNAYYYPPQNNINFMAGILQPPFYDSQLDDAVNFGAIGSVIGHELTHGFDDEGRQFDADGNLRDWWAPEDEKAFQTRTDCEVQEYSKFTVPTGEHVDGKLTLGENTADNGGVRIAFMALMQALAEKPAEAKTSIDGFTPEQRFFLGFGQIWCSNYTPEVLRLQVQTDPHSPGEFRVNGSISNFDEFRKAFGCKTGQPMVRDNACRVW